VSRISHRLSAVTLGAHASSFFGRAGIAQAADDVGTGNSQKPAREDAGAPRAFHTLSQAVSNMAIRSLNFLPPAPQIFGYEKKVILCPTEEPSM